MDFIRCQYIIARKNRPCKMLVKPDRKYCGEHQNFESSIVSDNCDNVASNPKLQRIPCPLDPKHTVYADSLDKHLKVCNSRLVVSDATPWIVENFNYDTTVIDSCDEYNLKTMASAKLLELIKKIERAWDDVSEFADINDIANHGVLHDLEAIGKTSRKHLAQQYSIAENLKIQNLVRPSTCFVEYGAGKAGLSYQLYNLFVEKTPNKLDNIHFLLIEKCGLKGKAENKVKGNTETNCPAFTRIRCGIEHVNLKNIPIMNDSKNDRINFVGLCKHLCGSAFDFALKSMLNSCCKPDPMNFIGAFLIPCCHHRCQWSQFCGRDAFEKLGFSKCDFKPLTQMTSWAICGFVPTKTKLKNSEPSNHVSSQCDLIVDGSLKNDVAHLCDRKLIGRKCKFILDYCRGQYLKKRWNCDISFKYFVTEDITPENLAFILNAIN